MDFEWNADKAAQNLRKHGVQFSGAARALFDPYRIEVYDGREDPLCQTTAKTVGSPSAMQTPPCCMGFTRFGMKKPSGGFQREKPMSKSACNTVKLTHAKKQITLRIDAEVLEFFKHTGKRYQSRMNAVLRSYAEAHKTHAK